MEIAAGAMRPLLGKLTELVKDEYGLEEKVRRGIKSLQTELEMMHAALEKVGEVPRDQLDEQVSIWAGMVRELSYDMEDAIDAFMVRVEKKGSDDEPATGNSLKNKVKEFLKKITGLFSKGKDLHQIAGAIEEAQKLAKRYGDLRQRYVHHNIGSGNGAPTIDPRMIDLYKDTRELVGIADRRDELVNKLLLHGDQELRTISIVGFGGLGKTTLAKAVYDNIKSQFDCSAFVSVGQNPDITKIFKKIFYELDKEKFENINEATWDVEQLVDQLRTFVKDKRYLIVIDDIWETSTWKIIRCALVDSNCGSRVVITTRISQVAKEVAQEVGGIYKMEPLSDENSKKLFYYRVFSIDYKGPTDGQSVEATKKILKKCGGVPLSIITIASLLVKKPIENWSAVYNSIGFGPENQNGVVENTRKILSFSYNDLPSHLKTCMMHLSIYPEDHWIRKDNLIWKWVAEGFVHEKHGKVLFEIGESYFNELVNKNMIQLIESNGFEWTGCRIHDMVLDLIRIMATEENFVAILDRVHEEHGLSSRSSTMRRIALHEDWKFQDKNKSPTPDMKHLRSFNAIECHLSMLPSFDCFQVLRVLELEGCSIEGDLKLKHLGKLHQLRYLGLRHTDVAELPSEVGYLVHLQVLEVSWTDLKELPVTVGKLSKLMCLRVDDEMRVPTWVGNLRSLQELQTVCLDSIDSYEGFVLEVRKLTELRKLCIYIDMDIDEVMGKALVESLCKLRMIQNIEITSFEQNRLNWVDCCEPSRQLRKLCLGHAIVLPRLPAWVESMFVQNLLILIIELQAIEAQDLERLANLPALRVLELRLLLENKPRISWTVAGGGLFPSLRKCFLDIRLTFLQGAMPMLTHIEFWLLASEDDAARAGDIGLGNLPQLNSVIVKLDCNGATAKQVRRARWAVRWAAHDHPKRPGHKMYRIQNDSISDMDKEDEEDEISDTNEEDNISDMDKEDEEEDDKEDEEDKISDTNKEIWIKKMRRRMTKKDEEDKISDTNKEDNISDMDKEDEEEDRMTKKMRTTGLQIPTKSRTMVRAANQQEPKQQS